MSLHSHTLVPAHVSLRSNFNSDNTRIVVLRCKILLKSASYVLITWR